MAVFHRTLSSSAIDVYAKYAASNPQKLSAYDEDAELSVTALLSLPTCNGRIGTTGMCLGGHLAYRCALDKRVYAAVCYFATDIHSKSLGAGGDDSLDRTGDIEGELVMVSREHKFGGERHIWGKERADVL
jgi:dienelactone hydrolase